MRLKKMVGGGLLALGITLAAAPAAHAIPITAAVEYTTAGTLTDSRPFTLGYEFTTSGPLNVNALGYWDDGLKNNQQVGIWDSVGTLLTSTTVLGTDFLQGHFLQGQTFVLCFRVGWCLSPLPSDRRDTTFNSGDSTT